MEIMSINLVTTLVDGKVIDQEAHMNYEVSGVSDWRYANIPVKAYMEMRQLPTARLHNCSTYVSRMANGSWFECVRVSYRYW